MGMLTNVFFFPEQKRQLCTANLSTPQEKKVLNNLQLPTARTYCVLVIRYARANQPCLL